MERTIECINQRWQRYSALVRRRSHHVSPPAAITSISAYHVPPSPVWNGMSLVFMPKKPVTSVDGSRRQHRQREQAVVVIAVMQPAISSRSRNNCGGPVSPTRRTRQVVPRHPIARRFPYQLDLCRPA